MAELGLLLVALAGCGFMALALIREDVASNEALRQETQRGFQALYMAVKPDYPDQLLFYRFAETWEKYTARVRQWADEERPPGWPPSKYIPKGV